MKPKNLMTPGELWFRVAFGALLIIVGLLLQSGISLLLIPIGVISLAWTIFRAVRQVKAAERIERDR